jgi:dephospho-CoA kinase
MAETSQAVVLGIVGLAGVGKSQAVQIVSEWADFEMIYFGGVVLDEVKQRGLELTPMNESIVREGLRQEFGMDVMAQKSLPTILGAVASSRNVLIDGLYSQSEYVLLKRHLGDRLKTIAVHSNKSIRAERLARRPMRPLTIQEMDLRDEKEIALLEKAPPIALADFHVLNNADIDSFAIALRSCLLRIFPKS